MGLRGFKGSARQICTRPAAGLKPGQPGQLETFQNIEDPFLISQKYPSVRGSFPGFRLCGAGLRLLRFRLCGFYGLLVRTSSFGSFHFLEGVNVRNRLLQGFL